MQLDRIQAPLLVVQGANDPRVKQEESEQLVAALRERGLEVEYMLKEDEGHGFVKEENQFEFYRAMEAFLEKHSPRVARAARELAPTGAEDVDLLRKLFEGFHNAFSIGIYSDPPGRDEIEAALRKAGLEQVDRAAFEALEGLARALDPGDFRQVLEKVALYKLDDPEPLTPDEVALCAPASIEAELDDILNVVAEGRSAEIGPLVQRLEGQGVNPVTLLIMAMRHFRVLYALASAQGGPQAGVQRLRPPLFGPRRDRMLRQAQNWSADRLEAALGMLMDTDLSIRSAGQRAPAMALVERGFVRLAWLSNRR